VTLPGGWAVAVIGTTARQKKTAIKVHRIMFDFEHLFRFFPLYLMTYLLTVYFSTD